MQNFTRPDNGCAMVHAEIPQVKNTYTCLNSRYSFINENGVAMGETTCGVGTSNDYGRTVRQKLSV